MDLSTIESSARDIEITHPATDEPIGLTMRIRPKDDTKVQNARRKVMNRNMQRRQQTLTAEQSEAAAMEVLVACVEDWTWQGDTTFNGDKPDCTPDNVRAVLTAKDWIYDQVDAEVANTQAFFTNSADDSLNASATSSGGKHGGTTAAT